MMNNAAQIQPTIPWQQALNLRVANDPLEILSTINKMYLDRSPVLVWQNLGGMRVLRKCFIKDIDFAKQSIVLAPSPLNKQNLDFNRAHTVYIRGNEKSILFKQDKAQFNGQQIVVDIPGEVRMYEKRTNPRIRFGHLSRFSMMLEKRINQSNQRIKEFTYPMYDLSVSGASVYFNPKEQIYFNAGENILIAQLGDLKFPSPLEGQVVYLKKVEFINDGHRQVRIKMGVAFRHPISQEYLRLFIKNSKK